ncbi:uncharacterized protein LOC135930795 [Gordionus sp. m RMFG-2023]|uniref:uncharacterized protein LOC135930795 n=1 Tax=Gordionus sp. m RMFG-2023 TaxID=3053472 RepID=UPI0031FDD34C
MIIETLNKFHIPLRNVYTITTDNGANLVKSIKLLNECSLDEMDDIDINNDDNNFEDISEFDIPEIIKDFSTKIYCIRCAAHTLQLAINDSLKNNIFKTIIDKARDVAKYLRTPTIVRILKSMKRQMAILDCTTRWSSICMMLERLISLKAFCDDFIIGSCEIILSEDDWNQIKDLTRVLVPLKITTLRLQSEQLCLSDFYGIWVRCRLELEKFTSSFSYEILENMKIREQQYLKNSVMYASIYLNPRYQVLLSIEQKQMAIDHLDDLWHNHNSIINNTLEASTSNGCSDSNDDSNIDDLEILLLDREKKIKLSSGSDRKVKKISIVSLIEKFSEVIRNKRDKNILTFWEENSLIYPELYTLSRFVMAVPATQVSVERGFSSLKYILSNLRGNLKDDILEDIMIRATPVELFLGRTKVPLDCLKQKVTMNILPLDIIPIKFPVGQKVWTRLFDSKHKKWGGQILKNCGHKLSQTQSQLISFKNHFVQITIIPKDMGMRFDTSNSIEGMPHMNNVTEVRKRRCFRCNSEDHLIQQCPSSA